MFTYLIWGVAYGFAAAIQPGPFQTYLITQTLRNGWRQTLPAVLAPLLSDGPIIALVLLVLSQVPSWWLQILRFVGGAFVLYLALGALQAWRHFDASRLMNTPTQQRVFRAALVNVLNPGPYVYWSLVMGPLLLTGWHQAPANGISLLMGFYVTMLISLVGILFLCAGAGKLGTEITRSMLGLSGFALVGFGLYQIWSGVSVWWQGG
jgi:threonine/homoserine/homoserine lactone efflux protein